MTDPFRTFALQQAVADALAEILPAEWSEATLDVRVANDARATTFEMELRGPAGEAALPTPEVSQAVAALVGHLRRAGTPCTGIVFDCAFTSEGWEVSGRVAYADG